jgi:hypothetical protein
VPMVQGVQTHVKANKEQSQQKKKATLDNGQWPTATPLDTKNPDKF